MRPSVLKPPTVTLFELISGFVLGIYCRNDIVCLFRISSATYIKEKSYFGSNSKNLYVLDPNGSVQWTYKTGGAIASSPAIGSDGTVYFGSDDMNLYALNSSGTKKWNYATSGSIKSSPAIGTNGTIYFGSNDMRLYIHFGASAGLANTPWPKFRGNSQNSGRH